MPILVRPVREQLEHDRVIRHLQAKLKRRYEVVTNVGDEQNAGVRAGALTLYPDLVLNSAARGRRIEGVIEVESHESVNHLEAMAQWAHFGRSRVPFQLYVPAGAVEMARRLCSDHQVTVTEIWSYHAIGDQIRFTMVHRAQTPAPKRERTVAAADRKAAGGVTRGSAKRPALPTRPAARSRAKTTSRKAAGRSQKRK